ncbi:MAG: DedA family protein [Alphaproteobacteria bacterium]|nr:DedA family protein [Alphaproteobacteria bacterium]
MITRLYAWTMRMAAHRRALPALAVVSFAESSFFPIPPDAMLVPMVLADRARAFRIATVCTIASVLGGLAGYAIGALLFEAIGRPIVEFYRAMTEFDRVAGLYDEYGLLAVVIGGLTPVPYKVVTIASGAFHFDLIAFTLASAATRGLRFFAVAAILWYWGPSVRAILDRYTVPIAWGFLVLIVAGFAALRWVF